MTRRPARHSILRRAGRVALVAAALALAIPEAALGPDGAVAEAQQLGEGMKRTGMVGIANDDERRLFYSLICTCGCPRESLGTCTCDFAHARREDLRALLEEGKTIEEIHTIYVQRYGTQALSVPPNTGASQALWALPVFGILLGAGGVIVALRRWKRRGGPPGGGGSAKGPGAAGSGGAPDAYDERIDRELEELDGR